MGNSALPAGVLALWAGCSTAVRQSTIESRCCSCAKTGCFYNTLSITLSVGPTGVIGKTRCADRGQSSRVGANFGVCRSEKRPPPTPPWPSPPEPSPSCRLLAHRRAGHHCCLAQQLVAQPSAATHASSQLRPGSCRSLHALCASTGGRHCCHPSGAPRAATTIPSQPKGCSGRGVALCKCFPGGSTSTIEPKGTSANGSATC